MMIPQWIWKGLIIALVLCAVVYMARSIAQIGRPDTNDEEKTEEDYDENSYH